MTKFFDSSRSIFAKIRFCLQVLVLGCQTENDVLDPALQQFYSSSSSHSSSGCLRSLIARCVDVFEQDLFMFGLKAKKNLPSSGNVSSYIIITGKGTSALIMS